MGQTFTPCYSARNRQINLTSSLQVCESPGYGRGDMRGRLVAQVSPPANDHQAPDLHVRIANEHRASHHPLTLCGPNAPSYIVLNAFLHHDPYIFLLPFVPSVCARNAISEKKKTIAITMARILHRMTRMIYELGKIVCSCLAVCRSHDSSPSLMS